jgi:hypothetical protein
MAPPGLSADDVVRIWELGSGRSPLERALVLLRAAQPERSWDELADLPLGARQARLLRLRADTVGSRIAGRAACPACGDDLELELDSALLAGLPEPASEPIEVAGPGYRLRARLPTSRDLLAVASSARDVPSARRLLAERCVLDADDGAGAPLDPGGLPSEAVAALAEALAAADPRAEALLDLTCPGCGHGWQVTLDVAELFWRELSALAERLLREVHALAGAYGWPESEILALSPARRRAYLELVGA